MKILPQKVFFSYFVSDYWISCSLARQNFNMTILLISQFLNEWKYWGYSQTNPDRLRFLIELEFKNIRFHEEENMNKKKRLKKRSKNKLKALMKQSLEC